MLTFLALMSTNFRYIGKTDSITISVWNHKKIHKKQGAGFLGCVRLLSNAINRLIDTGCKCVCVCINRSGLSVFVDCGYLLYHFFMMLGDDVNKENGQGIPFELRMIEIIILIPEQMFDFG